jgi:hypothetical protein
MIFRGRTNPGQLVERPHHPGCSEPLLIKSIECVTRDLLDRIRNLARIPCGRANRHVTRLLKQGLSPGTNPLPSSHGWRAPPCHSTARDSASRPPGPAESISNE